MELYGFRVDLCLFSILVFVASVIKVNVLDITLDENKDAAIAALLLMSTSLCLFVISFIPPLYLLSKYLLANYPFKTIIFVGIVAVYCFI